MNTTHFSPEFLKSIPQDTDEAICCLATEYNDMYQKLGGEQSKDDHDFLEAFAIIEAFKSARSLGWDIPMPQPPKCDRDGLRKHLNREASGAKKRLYELGSEEHFQVQSAKYRALFDAEPAYEFSDDDYEEIQRHITELRELIQKSKLIPENHKQRLLKRLEAMQKKLHKKTTDIDRFWGFIAEAGIVSRKFGEDLKPINDRVSSLGKIVIATMMSTEGIQALPGIVKLLEN